MALDAAFWEAVEVSSPSLAYRWRETISGNVPSEISQLRRVVRALNAYKLRMSTRSTPFGLMAGVAIAEISEDPQELKMRFGSRHRCAARPDQGWLTALVSEWERRPEILRHLRVMRNNLCFVRAGRLVLPYAANDVSEAGQRGGAVREVSVRYSTAVRAVVERTRVPLLCSDLQNELDQLFPQKDDAIPQMLALLVEKGILLTELRPRADTPEPTGHILDVLRRLPNSPLPELPELQAVVEGLTDYEARELGQGTAVLDAVRSRMRRMHATDRLVHVDLALDADVRIPASVALEAERAAELLWRLTPASPESSPMTAFRSDFVERYGPGRVVPVKALLDPDIGLGVPAGYRIPPSNRPPLPPPRGDSERDRLLLHLAQDALLSENPEVTLTDDHPFVRRLAHTSDRPPATLELFTQLVSQSPEALQDGDFRLVVNSASVMAGAVFGRFAYLLPSRARSALEGMIQKTSSAGDTSDEVHAQVLFQPRTGRGANVAHSPRLLEHRIPIGLFHDEGIELDDLGVCADLHRMFLVRLSDGQEVVPAVYHVLNMQEYAPNVARFLSELPQSGVHAWQPWDWGAATGLSHTPRVSYGRVILAPARWRPSEEILDQEAPFRIWMDRVSSWRKRWRIPERACLSYLDLRMELVLTDPMHLRLLRRELGRRPDAVLVEAVEGEEQSGTGWLMGPDGVHRGELVFPLLRRSSMASSTSHLPPEKPHFRSRSMVDGHLPGGEWLYAVVHCSPERQEELLAVHLSRLTQALPPEIDRWFFIRYHDSDHHVRLRFHGEPSVLAAQVLPGLHVWATELRAQGLIQRISLREYDPELERYGGSEAMAAAERFFHADSRATIKTLGLRASGQLQLEPVILAAASYIDMARVGADAQVPGHGEVCGEQSWMEWLLRTFPRGEMHAKFRERRGEALSVIDPYGDWAGLRAQSGGEQLLEAWNERSSALRAYRRTLWELGPQAWTTPAEVLPSLFHMHHNRLVGIDQDAEKASLAIARGAVQAHRDRRRRIR
ncbi:lantibiotic dehydratase [Streptomyces lydicus]